MSELENNNRRRIRRVNDDRVQSNDLENETFDSGDDELLGSGDDIETDNDTTITTINLDEGGGDEATLNPGGTGGDGTETPQTNPPEEEEDDDTEEQGDVIFLDDERVDPVDDNNGGDDTTEVKTTDDPAKKKPKGGFVRFKYVFYANGRTVSPVINQSLGSLDVTGTNGSSFTIPAGSSVKFNSKSPVTFRPSSVKQSLSGNDGTYKLSSAGSASFNSTDLNLRRTKTIILRYNLQKIKPKEEESSTLVVNIYAKDLNGRRVSVPTLPGPVRGVATTPGSLYSIVSGRKIRTTTTFGELTIHSFPDSIEHNGKTYEVNSPSPIVIDASEYGDYEVDIVYQEVDDSGGGGVTFESDPKIIVEFIPEWYSGNIPTNSIPQNIIKSKDVQSSRDRVVYTLDYNKIKPSTRVSFKTYTHYTTPNSVLINSRKDIKTVKYRAAPVNPPPSQKPKLRINTVYSPSLPSGDSKGDIFVNGNKVGNGFVSIPVDPGEYNITFGDINSSEYIYRTPNSIRVTIDKNSKSVKGKYIGKLKEKDYYTFKPIEDEDIKYYALEKIEGLFSHDIKNLTTMYSSSVTSSMEDYSLYVYQDNPSVVTSSIQFSLAYGHALGSGSDNGDLNDISITPSKAIYSQYRNKILEDSDARFNISGRDTDSIYVINYQHDRVKESLDYGAFEINLAHLSGSQYVDGGNDISTHTGSNVTLSGDDSVTRLIAKGSDTDYEVGVFGYCYDVVSGSIEDGVYNSDDPHVYGKFYSNYGVVILDGDLLDESASFGTVKERETEGDNKSKIFKSLSGSALISDGTGDLLGMKARRKIIEFNDSYFIRIGHKEFNRSNNNTYSSGSEGLIQSDDLKNNPTSYITTIGLYDDQRQLLAVGKLHKPYKKNYNTEYLFKVNIKH